MDRYFRTSFRNLGKWAYQGLLLALIVLGSCRTKKGDGSHFFQNLSARYNILFNGEQLVDEVRTNRWHSFRENYQTRLPVFIDPSKQDGENALQLMDSVVQKAYAIINTKEQSRYIPQAYFMMAQAHYEKANFYEASELFHYVSQIAHAQDFQLKEEAYAWRARMLLLTGRLNQAVPAMDSAFAQASHRGKKPLAVSAATKAAWLLQSGREADALPHLQQAVQWSKSQKEKLRWQYLLAQLLEEQQQYEEAYTVYTKVTKSNAAFELSFNAALRCVALESRQDPDWENHLQRLKKLAKNNKSIGFTDQIHYLIAESYLQANDTANAEKHLLISLKESIQNDYQRTSSYLALADLYFDQGRYGEASAYYDSTANILNSSYPSYKLISEKITHVDELIGHWQSIAREDTLRAIAQMPPEERERVIDSIIQSRTAKKVAQEESASSTNTALASLGPVPNNNEPILPNVLSSDHFYFNNPTAIGAGMSTFRRRWGNRALEDNWRWSSKSNLISSDMRQRPEGMEASSLGTAATVGQQQALLDKADYLNAIPDNPEKWVQSDQRISDALIQIGDLYRDVVKDPEHAIASYGQLLQRYPQSARRDVAYYNLYRLYGENRQDGERDRYRERLIAEFPNSPYTRSILDPNYLQNLHQEKAILDSLYTLAYDAYTRQEFGQVIAMVTAATKQAKDGGNQNIYAQLAYLKALSVGRTAPIQAYEQELNSLLENYPNAPLLAPIVKQQLSFIAHNRDSLDSRQFAITEINANRQRFEHEPNMTKWPALVLHADGQELIEEPRQQERATTLPKKTDETPKAENKEAVKPFTENNVVRKSTRNLELLPDSSTYYFVVDVRHATANLSPSRYGIGQFNRSQAPTRELRHQLMAVQNTSQLIYIGQFHSYDEVKSYANRIGPLLKDIMKVPQDSYGTFIITQQNLALLTDEEKINTYIDTYHSSNP